MLSQYSVSPLDAIPWQMQCFIPEDLIVNSTKEIMKRRIRFLRLEEISKSKSY